MIMSCILVIVILIGHVTIEVNLIVVCLSKGLCLSTRLVHEAVYLPPVGERLESGIKNALVLQSDEAVVLTAQEEFVDALPDSKPLPLWSHDQLHHYANTVYICMYMYIMFCMGYMIIPSTYAAYEISK